ncbi:hypothetical protein MMC25_006713 [Agyrium rufum]|nr:hypothetical protein [Agyrium rufum]
MSTTPPPPPARKPSLTILQQDLAELEYEPELMDTIQGTTLATTVEEPASGLTHRISPGGTSKTKANETRSQLLWKRTAAEEPILPPRSRKRSKKAEYEAQHDHHDETADERVSRLNTASQTKQRPKRQASKSTARTRTPSVPNSALPSPPCAAL